MLKVAVLKDFKGRNSGKKNKKRKKIGKEKEKIGKEKGKKRKEIKGRNPSFKNKLLLVRTFYLDQSNIFRQAYSNGKVATSAL